MPIQKEQMALVKCKECSGTVSDSAMTCPHCGVAAPSLTNEQKAQVVVATKRAAYGKMGGWLFFSGIGWLILVGWSGGGGEGVTHAWALAKYLIIGGAGMYIISEIDRNLAERRQAKAAKE